MFRRTSTAAALLLSCALILAVRADEPGAAPPAAAVAPEAEPLARVNGQPITEADVRRYLRLVGAGDHDAAALGVMSALEREELELQRKREALRALIERRLLYEVASEEYLAIESVREALEGIADEQLREFEERVGSRLEAAQVLSDLGLTSEDYRELQKRNLLTAKLLWDRVTSRVHVGPAETRAYYEERREQFRVPRTFAYRQILFTVTDEADNAERLREAQAVLERIRQGADFAEMADRHSDDRERCVGGSHEVAVPAECGDWVPPVVEGLEPGQLSEVRPVAGGFAIARLEKVLPAHIAPFEEVQARIKALLLQRNRGAAQAAFISRLKAQARIHYLPGARRLGLSG
ncbi:MAG: peptidylprolyl isomerase [Planctomycetota bacterium]|jgi:parvulin-like peptidyl-prolyl isomerase